MKKTDDNWDSAILSVPVPRAGKMIFSTRLKPCLFWVWLGLALFAPYGTLASGPDELPGVLAETHLGLGSGVSGHRNYTRATVAYAVPDIELEAHDGTAVQLASAIGADRAVMVNFVFTSCTTICPVLSSSFSEVNRRLQSSGEEVNLYSISIDPEYDTRDKISEYARRVGAGGAWLFLRGSLNDTFRVEKAFDTYRGNKMNHLPLTFMKPAGADEWVRLEGFPSAQQILNEYRSAGAR
ncbi:MAG: SCO family protein [Myxococcales bacterium]|nr:SCO family protein [Myxococcales bacterium]HIL80510.1 SCO family protein [Myxococcales bacterium]